MSTLLEQAPYGPRDETRFRVELNALAEHHRHGCPAYARICGEGASVALHVGVFKHLDLRTEHEGRGAGRTLQSSSTSGTASRIHLDPRSGELQARSSVAILKDFAGAEPGPLLILDGARSLRSRELSARVAAAMSLKPLASELFFLLDDPADPASFLRDELDRALALPGPLRVYGFTSLLWQAWPKDLRLDRPVVFVHSGGWKKLEARKIDRATFDRALLATAAPGSKVIDYYGLVEQVGVIYPLCEHGFRHVPVWAGARVIDPLTGEPVSDGESGALELANLLAWGAPYHHVVTEDLGRIEPGPCPCGRSGPRFELLGRLPKAEIRGCANIG